MVICIIYAEILPSFLGKYLIVFEKICSHLVENVETIWVKSAGMFANSSENLDFGLLNLLD